MYELCARLAPYNLLSDAGFSPGEGGLIRTTTSFLEDIEYEFNHQYGVAQATDFVQLRQAAKWSMLTIGLFGLQHNFRFPISFIVSSSCCM